MIFGLGTIKRKLKNKGWLVGWLVELRLKHRVGWLMQMGLFREEKLEYLDEFFFGGNEILPKVIIIVRALSIALCCTIF